MFPKYAKKWTILEDGGSGTWLYAAEARTALHREGRAWVFISVMDMPDACGKDANYLWCADVSMVELDKVPQEELDRAFASWGIDTDGAPLFPGDLEKAQILHSYGAKVPCWSECAGKVEFDNYGNVLHPYDENSTSFRGLRMRARTRGEELLRDEDARQDRRKRVVNTIGQTGEQYAQGTAGLWNRLREVAEDDNATPQQKLSLTLYQRAGRTLGGEQVPKDIVGAVSRLK